MITLTEFLTHAAAMVVGAASLALGLWAGGRLREWWTDEWWWREVVERLEKEQREQRLAGEDWQPGEDMRWPDSPTAWALEDPTFPRGWQVFTDHAAAIAEAGRTGRRVVPLYALLSVGYSDGKVGGLPFRRSTR